MISYLAVMESLDTFFENELNSRKAQGTLRALKITDVHLKDFTSNDYLGLARSAELHHMIAEATRVLPMNGSTGSRLLSGNSEAMVMLEKKLAGIFQCESSLVFNSGYAANLGVFSAIAGKHDTILYDELSHASMKDGIRLSLATRHSFKHNDLDDLERKIKNASGKIFIAAESYYSMDGDVCPLKELVNVAQKYGCYIVLDEAHSTGVIGPSGAGLAVELGAEKDIAIRIHTFGKAMGVHGACVAGSKALTNFLVNFSRPFIYTTAPAPHQVASISCAFDFLAKNIQLQSELKKKIALFHKNLPGDLTNATPIQTVVFSDGSKAKAASKKLLESGFNVSAIVSPTVPVGKERLRICLHTFNEDSEIVELAKTVDNLRQS